MCPGFLQHNEGADLALVHLIESRKQNRKVGLVKAKQRELLIRTRAIDILEVGVRRRIQLHTTYINYI